MCRYITRPALANERLKRNSAGQVVLQLKTPYQDVTTHIVMSPLELMQRLATLVPAPKAPSHLKHSSLDWPATSMLLRRLRRLLPWRARAQRPTPGCVG